MKHLLLTTVVAIAIPFLTPANAIADRGPNPEFAKIVKSIEETPESVSVEVLFDSDEGANDLDTKNLETLHEIAHDQAQVWGDTILEGDYAADGKTSLDRVESLSIGGKFVGYRITYSEKGWMTATCEYRGEPDQLEGCQEGRISEASLVSPQFDNYTRDINAYAEFYE